MPSSYSYFYLLPVEIQAKRDLYPTWLQALSWAYTLVGLVTAISSSAPNPVLTPLLSGFCFREALTALCMGLCSIWPSISGHLVVIAYCRLLCLTLPMTSSFAMWLSQEVLKIVLRYVSERHLLLHRFCFPLTSQGIIGKDPGPPPPKVWGE